MMARQLAIVPGVADLVIDTTRTVLRVAPGPRVAKRSSPGQGELKPDPARAKPVDEKAQRRRWATDLVDYWDEVKGPSEVRSRRHRVSAPRMLREGNRPESIGSGALSRDERVYLPEEVFVAEALDGRMGPPREFGECPPGPCARASCRHSLLIEIGPPRGERPPTIKVNHPGRSPADLKETCSLRAAEKADQRTDPAEPFGEAVMTCDEVAELLNLTPERIRQLEAGALAKLRPRLTHLREER